LSRLEVELSTIYWSEAVVEEETDMEVAEELVVY
jgi:hypothetical protein